VSVAERQQEEGADRASPWRAGAERDHRPQAERGVQFLLAGAPASQTVPRFLLRG